MINIPLERYKNVLILPANLPEQSYVICPTDDANCWHILPTELNNQLLKHLADTANRGDKHRLKLMMQGTYQDLERQGNLLLLPDTLINNKPGSQYVLKLAKKPANTAG